MPPSTTPPAEATTPAPNESFSTRVVGFFLQGPWPLLITFACLLAGAISLGLTPREEEPQIVVPTADLLVTAPGLSAVQVERQVAGRVEKLLSQIDGVEYVYSSSRAGGCIVTVRFYVGEDRENSLVKIYNKLFSNTDRIPPEVSSWVVKPIEIDDVPIVVATLWSRDAERDTHFELRRLAEEIELELQAVEDTGRITITGGRPRVVRVDVDPEALAARRTTALDVAFALGVSNVQRRAGTLEQSGRSIVVDAGTLVGSVTDLEDLVVNVVDGLPVSLRDVAVVRDGPEEPRTWTWLGFGPAAAESALGANHGDPFRPAVHVAIAKKKGTNAVRVAEDVVERLRELERSLIPDGIDVRITRNYGETAQEKVDELVEALAVAVLTVVLFVGLVLGGRAGIVIAIAIPVCYGATLLINYLFGYTINRVTLFALILALGLIVDDPITDVENIERVFRQGRSSARRAVLEAVQEVRPALIMSTVAIVLTFLPLFFITGMMGPYMEPMALNVPLAVGISTVIAFCVTPYLALKFLRPPSSATKHATEDGGPEDTLHKSLRYRLFDRVLRPLFTSRRRSWLFLGAVGLLFVLSLVLPALRLVPLKMLPFDNKNELQVVIHGAEGSTLETTDGVLRELAQVVLEAPEVESVATHAGVFSPMDFNGMVRRYYLRGAPNTGDLRIQLVHKDHREHSSHSIALRLRGPLEEVAARRGARIQIVEVPPGPPVLSTITVEIYGEPGVPYAAIEEAAEAVAARLRREPLVVDVDTTVEAPQERLRFLVDKEKAALSGVATEDVVRTLELALSGYEAAQLEVPREVNTLPIVLQLERTQRSDPGTLRLLQVQGRPGIAKLREAGGVSDAPRPLIALGELGEVVEEEVASPIYHKNLRRMAFVFAELAGRPPADAILDVQADLVAASHASGADHAVSTHSEPARSAAGRTHVRPGGGDPWSLPEGTYAVWNGEGEWQVTLDVFRDLGIAFGAANLAIFLVLWLQTQSVLVTLILMAAIPLTMIGVMPGFWVLNLLGERSVAGLPNPVFFTATAMIGMIALSGIVVRNSLVLVDFVHGALREGVPLDEALVRSCAIRMRPILLTAGTTLLGNLVITLDPVFSGLAWAIIFGIVASSLFSLGVVPVIYRLVYARVPGHGVPQPRQEAS